MSGSHLTAYYDGGRSGDISFLGRAAQEVKEGKTVRVVAPAWDFMDLL